jgi:EmrB/QacA subfamily drug resistance transporter
MVTAGYRTIALTVSTAIFMQFLDATALNTALPAIARDLKVPAVSLNSVILSYQLAMAALIPVGSAVAARLGYRTAFSAALFVFLIGSLLCAASHSLPALVAARALQGCGGAVMIPVSRMLVVQSAAKHELVSAMNWLLVPGIVGPLLGPVVGGLIVTYFSWPWIFLVNTPVALIGIALTLWLVPDSGERLQKRIDLKGVLLTAAGIVCILFGLDGVASPQANAAAWGLLAIGLLLAWLYVRHAAGNPDAVLDLTLLEIDSFRLSVIVGTMQRVIIGATGFLMPLWFQLAMGMSAARGGTLMVMGALSALFSRFIVGPLMKRVHPRRIAMLSTVALAAALLLTAGLKPELPIQVFYAVLFMQGLLVSMPLMIISAAAYVDVPAERIGGATGLYVMLQQVTLSLGLTAGVWAIEVMRLFAHTTPTDERTYKGSLIMLACLALLALFPTRKFDAQSLGALRPQERLA